MSVTPANAAMGPGTLYYGEFGAAEPALGDVSSAPSSADWTDLGGTLGGLTWSIAQTYKELMMDQVPIKVGSRRTAMVIQAKVKLAEVTLANLVVAVNGDETEDVTSGSGYSAYDQNMDNSCQDPNYGAIMFDGCGPGGLRRRVILRKALNTETVEVENTVDGQQGFQCTFDCHYVSDSIAPYAVIDEV
jgi:hypothetical protein